VNPGASRFGQGAPQNLGEQSKWTRSLRTLRANNVLLFDIRQPDKGADVEMMEDLLDIQ
jgi:hypothetical protein